MATESPIRILDGTDGWRSLKQSSRYGPSSVKKAIEGLDLFLKDQRFQSLEKDVIPSRSESAPPSMEGSLAAIENIFSRRSSFMTPDTGSDKRSSGPLNSSMTKNNLPAHKEESEDDQSSEQSLSVSLKKASSLDPTQEDSYYAPSPSYTAERDLNAVKVDEQERNINIFSSSNLGSHKFNQSEQLVPQSNAQSSNSQIIYPVISSAYSNNPNQFHYGPSNVSTSLVRPIPPLYAAAFVTPPNAFYPNLQLFTPQYNVGGYNFNSTVLPSYLAGYPHQGPIFDGVSNGGSVHGYDVHNLLKFYGQPGVPLQPPFHMQYFQPPVRDTYSSYSHFNHQASKEGAIENQVSSHDSRKGAEYKPQQYSGGTHNKLNLKRGNVSSHYYFGSPRNNGNISQSPNKANDLNPSYSFLEELKSGKGQRFELSEIVGHIVEFSVDQHGSRFIQQKLESCNVEEKASVFKEVVPHASRLMTDVFGNYVIQKLFEYGSPEQRKYLADQLEGQILPLSLQMYGCRVIQKALDVIDLEQKARLVKELDGHVIRCVRDQNGNHVIQKCIESIPANDIHFIISSFRGQVAMLSVHPYGCRVIQRVLEHCNDDIHTQFIVDEILTSVCSLAQDQYGNYVTQHVLERGKPRERREIIEKLGGSVVQLSHHKFASNVIEKCLEYSDSTSRGMLIKEIIGDADKNDNLLIMMKDQYANYVIQKIVEKCTGEQREVLLGLIRNHITALKKYTYGKHIVARFEQLYGDEIRTSGS